VTYPSLVLTFLAHLLPIDAQATELLLQFSLDDSAMAARAIELVQAQGAFGAAAPLRALRCASWDDPFHAWPDAAPDRPRFEAFDIVAAPSQAHEPDRIVVRPGSERAVLVLMDPETSRGYLLRGVDVAAREFGAIAQRSGIHVVDEHDAVALLRTCVKWTRLPVDRVVADRAEAVWAVQGFWLDDVGSHGMSHAIRKWTSANAEALRRIEPASAVRTQEGWQVVGFLAHGGAIRRVTMSLTTDASITDWSETLVTTDLNELSPVP
jgi:hypothetical protein